VSLSVDVWVPDESAPGGTRVLDVPEGSSDLAGFESTRTGLWGSPAVRELGAVLLPRLARGDLWLSGDEVGAFAAECALLLAHRAMLAAASGYDEGYLVARITNMADAAARALRVGGGVVVW
jgi:hypothetical protein